MSGLACLLIPLTAYSTTIQMVDRAIHDGFELIIFHCDSQPDFSLKYDRVAGIAELHLKNGRIGSKATQTLKRLGGGLTIRGATVEPTRGLIKFQTPDPVHIREYLVSGPSTLILDFGTADATDERLPFELAREDYLKLGSSAEQNGKLEKALDYVDHVRRWADSDIALTHRAGVIEQRLGRWDAALETLTESARIAEFAADAHARRTMIFLAKGDTAAMGDEWAGYFHRDTKKPGPQLEPVKPQVDSLPIATNEPARNLNSPNDGELPKLPRILKAGGDSTDYLYYGWGFLAVGFLSLIGLALSAKRQGYSGGSYGNIDISVRDRVSGSMQIDRFSTGELVEDSPAQDRKEDGSDQSRNNGGQTFSELRRSGTTAPMTGLETYSFDRRTAGKPTPRPTSAQRARSRVPVDRIVELSASGISEGEIAHQLMVGRDEVAMVLNLSRMARRNPANGPIDKPDSSED